MGVLFLQLLHLLGHQRVYPAVFRTPAVVRLLADAQLPADLRHLQAFAEHPLKGIALAMVRSGLLRHEWPVDRTEGDRKRMLYGGSEG